MHFSSHKTKILKAMKFALRGNKAQIVIDFQDILISSSSILNTDHFNFWFYQLKNIQINEIPITIKGLGKAKAKLKILDSPDKHQLIGSILEICKYLFTYSNYDDGCEMQGDYHSYYDESSDRVFNESDFGHMDPNFEIIDKNKIRIAKISELTLNKDELI